MDNSINSLINLSDDGAQAADVHGAEVAQGLVVGHLTVENTEHHLEGLFAHFLNGSFAGDDPAGVQVHVVLEVLKGVGVAADLDHRHGGEALGGAAAGGEHHELSAGGRHGGEDLRLAARGILDPQTLLIGDELGVLQHAPDGTVAGLDDGAQALLLDGAETAGDVAGSGLTAAHILAQESRTVFHVLDDLVDLLTHGAVLAAHSPAGQDVFAAQELGGLTEYHGGAQVDQLVGHVADDAVGGHAGGGVGGAALDGHDHVGDVDRLTLHTGDLHHQLLSRVDAGLNGSGGAAQLLDTDLLYRLAGGFQFCHQTGGVGAFAAEAHHQAGGHVGTLAQADESVGDPLQVTGQLAAALVMVEANGALNLALNGLAHIVGTDNAGYDGNQVAAAVTAVGPLVTVKSVTHYVRPPYMSPRPRRAMML